jgi:acetyl-CoA C-acetyltransferase
MASGKDNRIVVLGGGISKFAADRADGTIRDWVAEAVLEALGDAGADIAAIQHSVTSYELDHLSKQLSMGAVLQDTVGMCPKPNVRVEGGGATGGLAIRTAFAYLRSGLCESVVVYGAESSGRQMKSEDVRKVYSLCADIDWETPIIGSFTSLYAMMMQEHMRLYGTTEEQMAMVSVKNHRNARFNPKAHMPMDITVKDVLNSRVIAWPYKKFDCSLMSDGAAAMILSTEKWARKNSRCWDAKPTIYLTGTGCGTDFSRLGDRPRPYPGIAHFRAKREAAGMAYAMAGISNPRRELDVAEVMDSYTGVELQSYEDLGFCGYGESGPLTERMVFDLGGELPCNTSGGLIGQGTAPGAMGIAQGVEILRQLRGECDPRRQVRNAKKGLTEIHGGCGTYSVVHIFERRE